MITVYDSRCAMTVVPGDAGTIPADVVWIDLKDETEEEAAFVEHHTGLRLPSRHRLAEVETSSRLSQDGATLVMSSPVLFREDSSVVTTPVGFVLNPKILVTLRATDLRAFGDFVTRIRDHDVEPLKSGADAFVGLIEEIVDRMADGMEAVGADLDMVSKGIFRQSSAATRSKPNKIEARLRNTLQTIGRSGDTTGNVRDSLLGLTRMVAYVAVNAEKWIAPAAHARLETIRQDIASLNDYESHLTDKVQFLLDSTLGFINIEQNRTFKLLTIASVIGIPPTFVVGLYGMNFKNMPEYDWAWGYQWGLLLVLLSIVIPIVWLRRSGWF